MNKSFKIFAVAFLISLAVIVLLFVVSRLNLTEQATSSPCLNNGKKWQIGCVQSGEYSYSKEHLKALVNGLVKLGWVKQCAWNNLPKNADGRTLWNYIAANAVSDYLVFKENAFWSSEWNFQERQRNRKQILRRLTLDRDIDLIVASGLWSGEDLASNLHRVPVLIISSLNPVEYGVLRSSRHSFNHIFVKYDPDFILRQIRMFQIITGFRTLGVIYDPSQEGRMLSNMSLLEKYSKEMNFSLTAVPVNQYDVNSNDSAVKLSAAFDELSKHVDAVWITTFADDNNLSKVIEPVINRKIPSWSPYGTRFVESGAMLSMKAIPRDDGKSYAENFGMILNGATPQQINPIVENKYELVLNRVVAQKSEFKLPKGIVLAAENCYLSIKRK